MTIQFSTGDKEPVDLVEATEGLMRGAAEALARAIKNIEAGKLDEVKAVPGLLRDVSDTFERVQEERGRFDKLRKQVAGTVGTRALDFHAARDEIGRRLACLRDAGPG